MYPPSLDTNCRIAVQSGDICHPIEQQFYNSISPFAQKLVSRCLNYPIVDDEIFAESSSQEHIAEEEITYTIQLQASSNSRLTTFSNSKIATEEDTGPLPIHIYMLVI